MQSFTQSTLEDLSQVTGYPCVSIYFPTHRKGSETQQDPIRLKNALKEAGKALEAQGMSEGDADHYLTPARDLVEQFEFWQHQEAGLALFVAEGFFQTQQLPYEVEELTIVSDRFHTSPLLPLLTDNGSFYLLAASQNAVRFFEADRYSISEMPLADTPLSLEEALKYDEADPQLQMHQGAGNSVAYHGQGVDEDNENSEIRRFFHKVDEGVMAAIADQHKPLLFAGVDFLFPIYQDANNYPHLVVEQHLTGNPDNVGAEELHCNAWAALSDHFSQAQRNAVDEYHAEANVDKASDNIEELIPAAFSGQIDKLFMVSNQHVWGQFNAYENQLTIHEEKEVGDRDLLELAALKTLVNQGQVFMVEADEMPKQSKLAATLRYPLAATVPAGVS